MKYFLYIILFLGLRVFSQQTNQFTQFTFNKYGYNPSAAGTNINANIEIILGTRKQWLGFSNSPFTNFLSINYTLKPERSYKRWHNVGIYIDKDRAGLFKNESYYLSYALHLPITKKYNMSFGIFAGVKYSAIDRKPISTNDPVYINSYNGFFLMFPDIIPGMRVYNKKMFFDVSVKQLYKNKLSQGAKQIGNKSELIPQLYVSYGKKINLNNGVVFLPAVNVHTSFLNIPSVEINTMFYVLKRVGLGATLRNKDFISGIFQIRFYKNIVAGFSYDYSINRLRQVAPNSIEVMIGLTSMFNALGGVNENRRTSDCPTFDF
ncbi:MAG: PorP/SprF family type IX secretion system membrane protein [Bacteroidota bacterium]